MHVLTTREQTLVTNEYIRIRTRQQDIRTPHVMGNTMIPSFRRLELLQPSYRPYKNTESFFIKRVFTLRFIMLHTE